MCLVNGASAALSYHAWGGVLAVLEVTRTGLQAVVLVIVNSLGWVWV